MRNHFNLLIVDDNAADANLILRRLNAPSNDSYHFQTQHVANGEKCMESLKTHPPDCVLLDYLLGYENGLDVLRKIRALNRYLPIIMLTGEGDESIAVNALKVGASDYIVKNKITTEQLVLAILNSIKQSQLEKNLEDQRRELEDFAYTAAHDIKSPLTIIKSSAQLLQHSFSAEEKERHGDQLATITEVSENLYQFVSELLSYARSGRLEKELVPLDLKQVLQKSLNNLAHQIQSSSAEFVLTEDDIPKVLGDEFSLLQLFENVISNAIKYAKPSQTPRIEIGLHTLESKRRKYDFYLSIRDNGIGIDSKDLPKVLSPLYRAGNTNNVEGTGLGLSIVKKIMAQHNGEVSISSKPGEGTTVKLSFKKVSDPAKPDD